MIPLLQKVKLEIGLFDNPYIDDAYLNRIEMLRSDENIQEPSKSSSQLDLMLDHTEEEHA